MPTEGNPTGAQATPAMAAALAQTEEVVMTKDGPRPLTPEEQAGNSPAASTEGAPAETAAPATEGAPASAPAATPAPAATAAAPNTLATASPSTARVIDAAGTPVAATPAPAAAPTVAAPAQTVAATPAPAADNAGLEQLAAFVTETNAKAAATVEDARRLAQSQADRQATVVAKQLEAASTATTELRTKMHELEVRDLNPEDRAKAIMAFEQRDEREELDRIRTELTVTHRGVFTDSLVLEYSPYGISREDIETASDVPEAMELYCEQRKSAFLQEKLDNPEVAPTTVVAPTATVVAPAAAPVATPTPVAAAPAQPVPVAAANAPGAVPAGAEAPSDVGSTGAAAEAWKPNEDSGQGAMKENIQHMGWEKVQLPS